jgi:endogenous inhibitor of DNA gyrase (YacG/DUF329 family)
MPKCPRCGESLSTTEYTDALIKAVTPSRLATECKVCGKPLNKTPLQ